jgi:hypothetical protein
MEAGLMGFVLQPFFYAMAGLGDWSGRARHGSLKIFGGLQTCEELLKDCGQVPP